MRYVSSKYDLISYYLSCSDYDNDSVVTQEVVVRWYVFHRCRLLDSLSKNELRSTVYHILAVRHVLHDSSGQPEQCFRLTTHGEVGRKAVSLKLDAQRRQGQSSRRSCLGSNLSFRLSYQHLHANQPQSGSYAANEASFAHHNQNKDEKRTGPTRTNDR